MAYFNNQSSYINEDNPLRTQQYSDNNSQSNLRNTVNGNEPVQVIYSNLQPTASEFQPASSNSGAIRKEPQRNSRFMKGSRNNSFGSGRTFSNSGTYKQKYDRPDQMFVKEHVDYNKQQNEFSQNQYENSNAYYRQNVDHSKYSYGNYSKNSFDYNRSNDEYNNVSSSQNHFRNNFEKNSSKPKYDHFNRFDRSTEKYKEQNNSYRLERPSYNSKFKRTQHFHGKKGTYNKISEDKNSPNAIPSRYDNTNLEDEYYQGSKENYNVDLKSNKPFYRDYDKSRFERRHSGNQHIFSRGRPDRNKPKNKQGKTPFAMSHFIYLC